jgi:hypothetical protein
MKNSLISICRETANTFYVQYAFTISHVLFSIMMQSLVLEYACYDMTNMVHYYAVLHFLSWVENFFLSNVVFWCISWEFEGWSCEQWISQCTLLDAVLQFWPWSNCAPHMVESDHWWKFHILVTVCCEPNTSAASAHAKVSTHLILSCHPELY